MAQVVEDVHRLGSRYVNWYVIEQRGKLTILDAGLPAHWEQLARLLSSIDKSMADVEAVILTHYHPDHLGVAARVRGESGARVLAHPTEIEALAKGGKAPSPLGIAGTFGDRPSSGTSPR